MARRGRKVTHIFGIPISKNYKKSGFNKAQQRIIEAAWNRSNQGIQGLDADIRYKKSGMSSSQVTEQDHHNFQEDTEADITCPNGTSEYFTGFRVINLLGLVTGKFTSDLFTPRFDKVKSTISFQMEGAELAPRSINLYILRSKSTAAISEVADADEFVLLREASDEPVAWTKVGSYSMSKPRAYTDNDGAGVERVESTKKVSINLTQPVQKLCAQYAKQLRGGDAAPQCYLYCVLGGKDDAQVVNVKPHTEIFWSEAPVSLGF